MEKCRRLVRLGFYVCVGASLAFLEACGSHVQAPGAARVTPAPDAAPTEAAPADAARSKRNADIPLE